MDMEYGPAVNHMMKMVKVAKRALTNSLIIQMSLPKSISLTSLSEILQITGREIQMGEKLTLSCLADIADTSDMFRLIYQKIPESQG